MSLFKEKCFIEGKFYTPVDVQADRLYSVTGIGL